MRGLLILFLMTSVSWAQLESVFSSSSDTTTLHTQDTSKNLDSTTVAKAGIPPQYAVQSYITSQEVKSDTLVVIHKNENIQSTKKYKIKWNGFTPNTQKEPGSLLSLIKKESGIESPSSNYGLLSGYFDDVDFIWNIFLINGLLTKDMEDFINVDLAFEKSNNQWGIGYWNMGAYYAYYSRVITQGFFNSGFGFTLGHFNDLNGYHNYDYGNGIILREKLQAGNFGPELRMGIGGKRIQFISKISVIFIKLDLFDLVEPGVILSLGIGGSI